MSEIATTRMSSKGQVVIPEEIRKKLNLKPGARFIVVAERDALLLKLISPPSKDEFERLLASAREAARKAGITKRDIEDAIKKVRQTKSSN